MDVPVERPYSDVGHGPAVVLVHGSNTDQRVWSEHSTLIAPHRRVVAVTQRYFGTAPWPDDGTHFSVDTHADDLAAFLRALSLVPVALVGWSYGAAVCLVMGTRHPELVERLVLYEPADQQGH